MEIKSFTTWVGLALTCVGNAMTRILPENFNWLGYPILAIGIAMLLIAVFEWVLKKQQWSFRMTWRLEVSSFLPFETLVSLEKAVEKLHEDLTHTQHGGIMEIINGGNPIIHLYDMWGKVRFFGAKGKTKKIVEISNSNSPTFTDDYMIKFTNENIEYGKIKVPLSELKRYIRSIKD